MRSLAQVRKIRDPKRRAEAAVALMNARADELAAIRATRNEAALEMLSHGPDGRVPYRAAEVARVLGITRSAVNQQFPRADRT